MDNQIIKQISEMSVKDIFVQKLTLRVARWEWKFAWYTRESASPFKPVDGDGMWRYLLFGVHILYMNRADYEAMTKRKIEIGGEFVRGKLGERSYARALLPKTS